MLFPLPHEPVSGPRSLSPGRAAHTFLLSDEAVLPARTHPVSRVLHLPLMPCLFALRPCPVALLPCTSPKISDQVPPNTLKLVVKKDMKAKTVSMRGILNRAGERMT